MKLIDIIALWEHIGKSLGFAPKHSVNAIEAPTQEQRTRGMTAFRRLRAEAQNMKSPLSHEEIVGIIRQGRR